MSFVGFGIPKWSNPLNHLAYADDTIIFAYAHPPSLSKIMAVLGNYEKISGQMINKDKSSYYMYSKIPNGLCQAIGAITGFARSKFPFTYLGCLIFYTRRRREYYEDLINKVKAKLHSWKGKLLSFGGKATLITSVLQSMLVHMLSVLHPPKNVLEHLHKIFARFFWSTKEEGRSRHWASWQNLCLHKEEGGLELLQGETWDDQLLDQTFNEEIAEHIRLNVHYKGNEGYWDSPYWMPTPSGKFSVSSAWQILRHRADPNHEFKLMWIKGLPFKISFFLWRLWRKKMSTDDMWRRQGQMVIRHWWYAQCCPKLKPLFQAVPAIITWELWKRRNAGKHGGSVSTNKGSRPGVTTNVVAEAKAILQGLEYCVEHDLHPLILETDSLVMKKVTEGECDPPWVIANDVKKIIEIEGNFNVVFQDVFREGNLVADFIANIVFSFVGTSEFHSLSELPSTGRRLIN
ncbi:PREDICTED: uncharacterized protein LOC109234822 [Nicotiana attenuata]|uniref:uncharacterized protein LOC109234822 n=1 Tax=Nicotiana attenuata TaxID=49451 RepID=UPI000904E376|nr:PREDICTED: uncharacterized protein LOC109234822 [Nicotiana attenuata]